MFKCSNLCLHFSMEWQASFAFLSRSHSLTQVSFFFLFLGFQFYHNVSRTIQVENHKSLVFNFKIHHSLHEKASFINHSFLTYNIYLKTFLSNIFSQLSKNYIQKTGAEILLTVTEAYLQPSLMSTMELFCKNSWWLKAVNYFCKTTPS